MIAKVYYKGREYYSTVFAIFKRKGETAVIVFDDNAESFEMVNAYASKYGLKQQIYVTDYNSEGYVEKDSVEFATFTAYDCLGLDWVLNDAQLLNDIEKGKEADKKYINLAKRINNALDADEWREVKTQQDADELLSVAGGFHDSYLVGMDYVASDTDPRFLAKLRLNFSLYNNFNLALELDTDIKIRYDFDTNLNYVYTSCIVFDKNYIYWICDEDECTADDIDDKTLYFGAKRLRWKIVSKNQRII